MLSLKAALNQAASWKGATADYVIEEGRVNYNGATDSSAYDYWIYRKWNSGLLECWTRNYVNMTFNTAWGAYLRTPIGNALTFPVAFIEIPTMFRHATPGASNGDGAILLSYAQPTKTSTGTCFFGAFRTTIVAADLFQNVYAFGNWKTPTLGG